MDPELWELYFEGDGQDEVMAILRLREAGRAPENARLIAEFGSIVTCRVRREDIPNVRGHPAVASMKAPDPVVPEPVDEEEEASDRTVMLPTDIRRPGSITETGKGIVIGFLDWGCDFAYPSFRNPDGTTRLLALWDQEAEYDPGRPNKYGYGRVYASEEIDAALATNRPYTVLGYDPTMADLHGHGTHATHVIDIAAGNGLAGGPSGIAPEASLVFVQLSARKSGFVNLGHSVTLLEGFDFIRNTAREKQYVIHLSLGNIGGPHDGTTLVEQAMDNLVESTDGCAVCQSCGNYHRGGTHTVRQVRPGQTVTLHWETDPADITPNELEIWYSSRDRLSVQLVAPTGEASDVARLGDRVELRLGGRLAARIYNRPIDPNNLDNHIHIFQYVGMPSGVWPVVIVGEDVVDGRFHGWIERDEGCSNCQSRFRSEERVPLGTTNTISNGFRTITVGAFNGHAAEFEMGPFSSAGPTRDGRSKPDLCGPGVRVLAARSAPTEESAGSPLLTRKSGTSMAAPYGSGLITLLFEAWPGRRLPIAETRRILFETVERGAISAETAAQAGAGVLNIEAAIAAVKKHYEAKNYSEEVTTMRVLSTTETIENCREYEDMPEILPGMLPEVTDDLYDAEELIGQARLGGPDIVPVNIRSASADYSTKNFDDALQYALSRASEHTVIKGNLLTGSIYEVFAWGTTPVAATLPPVIELDTAGDVCCLSINGGSAVYFSSNLATRVLRWVQIPRLREFYALAQRDRTSQRSDWIAKIAGATASISIPGVLSLTPAWLRQLSMPALRLLLAQFGQQIFRVRNINQPPNFRGADVVGATLPLLKYPIEEPDCYLPVIAGREGKLEAINAYDLGAGISLGPIQFNLQRSAVIRFLSMLNARDRQMFQNEFGSPHGWSLQIDGDHTDLVIAVAGGPPVTLHGRQADEQNNIGFFQCGTAGRTAFADIDAAFRRTLLERFRNVVVWPHVQEIIIETSSWLLMRGLEKIHDPANGIPALDPRAPDHDTFILKALLLSAYVRFSACLDPLLVALRAYATNAQKLANIENVLSGGGTWTNCPTNRRMKLHPRLHENRPDAERTHDVVGRIHEGPGGKAEEAIPDLPKDYDLRLGTEQVEQMSGEYVLPCGGNDKEFSPFSSSDSNGRESVVRSASEAIAKGIQTPAELLHTALEAAGSPLPVHPLGPAHVLSPAEVFDAMAGYSPVAVQRHHAHYFEIVGAPSESLRTGVEAGDLLLERAIGEGGPTHVWIIASSEVLDPSAIGLRGGRGLYANVASGMGEQMARPIARADGRLGAGQLILRMRPSEQVAARLYGEDTDQFACDASGSSRLLTEVINAVTGTRMLAAEALPITAPACKATTICPISFQPFHDGGNATHFVQLDAEMTRVAELASLFRVDLSANKGGGRVTKKAGAAVKNLPIASPLDGLSFVAIRQGTGQRIKREIHIHKNSSDGGRFVQSFVDGEQWDSLPYQAAPGVIYTLMKTRWPEASLHRQWGKRALIAWIKCLCNFYRDRAGVLLGVGDVSHVVGETMTDHGSHRRGVDVDLYVLEYAGAGLPISHWCDGTSTLTLTTMPPPSAPTGSYSTSGGNRLSGSAENDIWRRFATVIAYCYATWGIVQAVAWHGVRQIESDAATVAQLAFDAGWSNTWGPAPPSRAVLSPPASERATKLIGQGSDSYGVGRGWPPHNDHIHIRLNV
jgi:hypothetical protein